MKRLIRVSLIKSVGIAITELGKLQCKLLSVKTTESPRPSMVTSDDYFTTNHQLALYLNRCDSAVEKYRYQGFIPFINEGGRILIKKTDVDNAVKLNPHLAGESCPQPHPAVPSRIFTQIVEASDEISFIHFTYQHRDCWIPVAPKKAADRNAVYSLCQKVIQLLHQVKPFKTAPPETKIAA